MCKYLQPAVSSDLWKESLNCDGQEFRQYQQSEQQQTIWISIAKNW
jgi:hypothetical protein